METSHHNFSFSELIPGLPDELGLECLTRLPYQTHRVASRVCRRWRSLIESREFHHLRRTNGHAHKLACLVHALDKTSNRGVSDLPKRGGETAVSFGIAVFDSTDSSWHPIDPVPKYPDGLPLFCRIASCEGKLVVIGGWDPQTYEPVTDIFVFDFVENRWREGRKMPEKRSFFAVGSDSCRIYVAGGHDENKNALSSAWAYDVDRDEWNELTRMSRERDESEGVVIGGEFWVVSGYGTESQGAFDSSAEVYNSESKTWRRVEGVWEKGRSPRGCLGVWMEVERRLASWGELDSAVRVGTCGVALGDHQAVVAGSPCQDGTHGFHLVELKEGQNGKFEKISVPSEFCGPVQSACCVEI